VVVVPGLLEKRAANCLVQRWQRVLRVQNGRPSSPLCFVGADSFQSHRQQGIRQWQLLHRVRVSGKDREQCLCPKPPLACLAVLVSERFTNWPQGIRLCEPGTISLLSESTWVCRQCFCVSLARFDRFSRSEVHGQRGSSAVWPGPDVSG
jgi:hypothetical protein